MAWATSSPGASASSRARKRICRRRATSQPPRTPSATAPQMPRPPCQIFSASTRVAAGPEVELVVGDHVVQPGTDDAERDADHENGFQAVGGTAPRTPAPVGDHHRREDARDDAERVRAQRKRADVPDAGVRARDRQAHPAPAAHHLHTRSLILSIPNPSEPASLSALAGAPCGNPSAPLAGTPQPPCGKLRIRGFLPLCTGCNLCHAAGTWARFHVRLGHVSPYGAVSGSRPARASPPARRRSGRRCRPACRR